MVDAGKIMIALGGVIIVIGLIFWGLGKIGFHGLPGDVRYESPSVRFYFPIATCLVLSAVLTAGMWLWQWLTRK